MPGLVPEHVVCLRRKALEDVASTFFDGDTSPVIAPSFFHSLTVAAGNAANWMQTNEAVTPSSPTSRAVLIHLRTTEVSRSSLDRVEHIIYGDDLNQSPMSTRITINYPASRSSINFALGNFRAELREDSAGDLKSVIDALARRWPKLCEMIKGLGLSRVALIVAYISTGATGLSSYLAARELRNRLLGSEYVVTAGFNILQVSEPGSHITDAEASARFQFLVSEVLRGYIKKVESTPLIIIPYDIRRSGREYATNEDIAMINSLLAALASARNGDIAGNITDIMTGTIYAPTRVIDIEVIRREGADVLQHELLTGGLLRREDLELGSPVILAYASNRQVAVEVLEVLRRSALAANLATNNIVLRYDELTDYFSAKIMILYPIKDVATLITKVKQVMHTH